MTILEFASTYNVQLSPVQKVVLKLFYGLPLNDTDTFSVPDVRIKDATLMTEWHTHTEVTYVNQLIERNRFNEVEAGAMHLFLVAGRRSGKGHLLALILAYETWLTSNLDRAGLTAIWPGCLLSLLVVSYTKESAVVCLDEAVQIIERVGELKERRVSNTRNFLTFASDWDRANPIVGSDGIIPRTSTKLMVRSALAKALRGHANRLVVLDEYSVFPKASADDVYNTVTPSLAATEGRMVVTGTPWSYDNQDFFGRRWLSAWASKDTVALQIPSWQMNPNVVTILNEGFVSQGTVKFLSEWGAEFIERVELLLPSGYTACDPEDLVRGLALK
jgi:hypothetical protein